MNTNDTLPELILSAKGIIKATAGIKQFSEFNLHTTGLQLDGHAIAAIAREVRALETALSRLEHSLAVVDEERHQLEAAFVILTSDAQEDPSASTIRQNQLESDGCPIADKPVLHLEDQLAPVPGPPLERVDRQGDISAGGVATDYLPGQTAIY